MVLPTLKLDRCFLDSPEFRKDIEVVESAVYQFENFVKIIVKQIKHVIEAGNGKVYTKQQDYAAKDVIFAEQLEELSKVEFNLDQGNIGFTLSVTFRRAFDEVF